MNSNSDLQISQLVSQAKNGDLDAFAQLYNFKWREIHYFAANILRNEQDGMDAAQEAFICVYQNIEKLKNVEKFNIWLFSITRNVCRKKLRIIRKDWKNVDVYEMDPALPEENPNYLPQEFFEKSENRKRVLAAINRLSVKQRETLLLFYYQNMSREEIAETLKISVSATAKRLARARQEIKAVLEQDSLVSPVLFGAGSFGFIGTLFHQEAQRFVQEIAKVSWMRISKDIGGGAHVADGKATSETAHAAGRGTIISVVLIVTGLLVGGGYWVTKNIDSDPGGEMTSPISLSVALGEGMESLDMEGISADTAAVSESPAAAEIPETPNSVEAESGESDASASTISSQPPLSSAASSPSSSDPKVYRTLADFLGEADANYLLYGLTHSGAYRKQAELESLFTGHKLAIHGNRRDIGGAIYVYRKLEKGGKRLDICEKIDNDGKTYALAYQIVSSASATVDPLELDHFCAEHQIEWAQ